MKTNPLIGIKVLIVATLSSVTLFLQLDACAQSLTPVHILVGFPSGGGADAVARLLAERLEKLTGRAHIVDNKTGATMAKTSPPIVSVIAGATPR